MERIKFRGKRTDNGKWVCGGLIFDTIVTGGEYLKPFPGNCRGNTIDTETVGQWIGRKDKNGVEIYEGDIMQFEFMGRRYRGIIVWRGTGWYFDEIPGKYIYTYMNDWLCNFSSDISKLLEVIGNIHDNPEMIEGVE